LTKDIINAQFAVCDEPFSLQVKIFDGLPGGPVRTSSVNGSVDVEAEQVGRVGFIGTHVGTFLGPFITLGSVTAGTG
jgi:hypothetical protein